MTSTKIKVGMQVSFDSGRGIQKGTVLDLLPCLSNGREYATVEIDHELPGMLESVPVDELTAIQSTTIERRNWRVKHTATTGVNHG